MTDHPFELPKGLSVNRAIDEFGELLASLHDPNDSMWIFTKKPVTTYYYFNQK